VTPALSRTSGRVGTYTPEEKRYARERDKEYQNFYRKVGAYEEGPRFWEAYTGGLPIATDRSSHVSRRPSRKESAALGRMDSQARGVTSIGIETGNPTSGYSTPARSEPPLYYYTEADGTVRVATQPRPYIPYDPSSPQRHSRSRRGIALIKERENTNTIESMFDSSQTTHNSQYIGTPFSDPTSEFQFYMNIYQEIQANVSDLLFPYFDTVLNNTNSYDLVWSVYSNLVAKGPFLIGPYSNGMTCFDAMEQQTFGNISLTDSTGHSTYNASVAAILLTDAILIDIYTIVWGNATEIANQTGYLQQMDVLRQFLSPMNSSIIPSSWYQTETDYDTSYFTIYNRTMNI